MENTDEKPHVLILDDDQDIHTFLSHELEKEGFVCVSAYTEEEAITHLSSYDFAYAIFDIILSSSSSSDQVIHYLNTDEAKKNKHLPTCVMSAHMNDDYAKKVRIKGSNVFATFKKPLKKGEITAALRGNNKKAVLLVEDDPDIAKLIKSELEKQEIVAYPVRSTHQAIQLLKTTSFLCAIVDNQLDGEDSQAIFDFLSKEALDLNLPIILTGTETRSDLEEDSYLMVFDNIPKPFKRGHFSKSLTNLKSWIEHHEQSGDNTSEFSPEDLLTTINLDSFDEEGNLIPGSPEGAEDSQVVGGDNEDDNGLQRVSGKIDEGPDNMVVKGSSSNDDDNFTYTVKGGNHDDEGALDYWQTAAKNNQEASTELQADIDKRNHLGMTPIMIFCLKGDIDTVVYLAESGADLGLRCKEGRSCLHYAARSDNTEILNYLLGKGVKVNTRDQHNHEALYDAIITKRLENVKVLLESGSRTTTRFEGRNYLTIAVLVGHLDIVKLMLEQGLDPKFEDYKGKSAIDYAKAKGFTDIHDLLTNKNKQKMSS